MSKAALQKVADDIKNTTAKTIRESLLNRQTHVFSIDMDSIADEIASEISYRDEVGINQNPEFETLLDKLPPQLIDSSAEAFYRYLTSASKLSPFFNRSTSTFTVSKGAGTYRLISDELTKASQQAITLIEAKVGYKTGLNAGKFIQFDHNKAVANIRTAYALSKSKEASAILNKLLKDRRISEQDFEVYADVLSYYDAEAKNLEFSARVVEGKLESGASNEGRGNTVELSRRGAILRAMTKLIMSKDLGNLKSSDSFVDYALKRINNAAVKSGAKGTVQKLSTAKNKADAKTKVKSKVNNILLPQIARKKNTQKLQARSSRASLDLVGLINAKLGRTIISNMGPSTLVNRTGRLASSAKVTGIVKTPQGYDSLTYTYQRSPYDVFDPVLGKAPWNTPGRDPRKLIEKSIRQIAAEYAKNRFYMRRV